MFIAQFELLGRVSETATGSVWNGWDSALQRGVALKQVRSPSNPQWTQLLAEATTLADLHHENIVQAYDLIEEQGDAWLVQEWIEGVSLSTIVRHNPELTPQQSLSIMRGALAGLAHAHSQNIVHGDISPANILVDAGGTSKLIDFGLAGRMGRFSAGGTPGFASLEAMQHDQLAPTMDVYSAAVVVAGLLRHEPLFGGPDVATVLVQQRQTPNLNGMRPAIQDVLRRALAADPAQRQPDAATLLSELTDAVERTYGPGWLSTAGVAALVAATTAAVTAAAQVSTALGATAVAGSAAATGSTATVVTSTSGSSAAGIGAEATGLGSTGASNADINFVSELSNTTGAAQPPEVAVNLVADNTVAQDSATGPSTGGSSAAVGTSTAGKPVVLATAAAAVVAILIVAGVFLFGGGEEPKALDTEITTVAASVESDLLTDSGSPAASGTTVSSTRNSTTSASTTSTSSTSPVATSTIPVEPADPALGFSGVYSYHSVVTAATGSGQQELGIEQDAVWDVTTTCDTACTTVANSSSGRIHNLIEGTGGWTQSATDTDYLECIDLDTGESLGYSVDVNWVRSLQSGSSIDGHIEQLQGETVTTQTEPCINQQVEFYSITVSFTLTYLGPNAVMTLDPTPAVQTS